MYIDISFLWLMVCWILAGYLYILLSLWIWATIIAEAFNDSDYPVGELAYWVEKRPLLAAVWAVLSIPGALVGGLLFAVVPWLLEPGVWLNELNGNFHEWRRKKFSMAS